MVAMDVHADAAIRDLLKPLSHPRDRAVARAGKDDQLQARAVPREQRVFGDRLGGVWGEPENPLEVARAGWPRDPGSNQHAAGRLRRRIRAGARSIEHRGDEIAVRTHLRQKALRKSEAELLLDPDPDVGEVERVGRELVGQRDLGCEVVDIDAETFRDDTGEAGGDVAVA